MSESNPAVFVTGATGLVGSQLCLDLLLAGQRVRALRRPSSGDHILKRVFKDHLSLLDTIEWVEGDVTEVLSIYDALEGIETVYHAAGLVSFDPKDRTRLMEINTDGTTNMVNMSLERGVKRFCHISSVAALGRVEEGSLITEAAEWKTSRNNSRYAVSKYAAEREVWRGMEEGLDVVILNPAIILGPGEWNAGSSLLFRAVWNGLKFYPQGGNGFVDVRDVSRIAVTLMAKECFGQRFVVCSGNIRYRELFTLIAETLGKRPPSIPVSPVLSSLAWRLEKVRSLLTGSSPVITKETANTSSRMWEYDARRSIQSTGASYIPLKDSVRHWASFYLNEGVSS